MNGALTRMLSLALVVASSGLVLARPAFGAEPKRQVTQAEYERILAEAIRKGCTQVKNCR